jgi:hypothetical protein
MPEWLGGGECRIVIIGDATKPATVLVEMIAGGQVLEISRDVLTEVKPPLPEEPPTRAVRLVERGVAWQRVANCYPTWLSTSGREASCTATGPGVHVSTRAVHLKPSAAREMARALWTAADAAEATP